MFDDFSRLCKRFLERGWTMFEGRKHIWARVSNVLAVVLQAKMNVVMT